MIINKITDKKGRIWKHVLDDGENVVFLVSGKLRLMSIQNYERLWSQGFLRQESNV